MKHPKIKIESTTILVLIIGMAIIGLILSAGFLGVLQGIMTAEEVNSLVVAVLVLIWSIALVIETVYESPGIKGLDDFNVHNIIALVIAIFGLITGFAMVYTALTMTNVVPANLTPLIGVEFLGLSLFLLLELKE